MNNIDWQAIRTWAMANIRTIIFILGTFLLLGFIFFRGSAPDSKIPGGGFGTLVLAGLIFFGAHKAGVGKIRVVLGSIATILLIVAIWPAVFPLINSLGLAPNIIMILAILVGVWMVKGGKGFFAWRMFLLIFLVLCWIGSSDLTYKDNKGNTIKDDKGKEMNVFQSGFNRLLKSTGIEMKIPDIKIETPKAVKGLTSHLGRVVDQQVSQSKERWVKKDAKLYKYNGTFSPNAVVDTDSIKVFLLGEQIEKDGLTFEKVRLNDPAVGEEFWIYSGDLLSYNSPSSNVTQQSNEKNKWKEVDRIRVDFSGISIEAFGNLNFPKIPIVTSKTIGAGNYRIKLDGNWQFFLSNGEWKDYPWQGKTYANNRPEYRPDKAKNFCAVILLNNGEDITPINEEGFILNSTGSVNLSVKLNVIMRADEYYSDKISGINKLTLRNSAKEPLTIIIEKEV